MGTRTANYSRAHGQFSLFHRLHHRLALIDDMHSEKFQRFVAGDFEGSCGSPRTLILAVPASNLTGLPSGASPVAPSMT
jgi:hypothetical protein